MARYSTNDNPTIILRKSSLCTFNSPGTSNWTVPVNITCATFELWGSGGGGGAKCCCDCYHQGSGGSGGIYAAMTIPVTAGDTYTLVIPAGGMYCSIGSETSHWCCQGGAGGTTYVTGTGITKLCAPGGQPGNNYCYGYCQCGDDEQPHTYDRAYIQSSAPTAQVSCSGCVVNYCNEVTAGTTAGGCHRSFGWVGVWTDSQSMYYPTYAGGTSYGSGMLRAQDWCCNNHFACANCTMPGAGGSGAHHYSCSCLQGGVGRNGMVQIRF